MPTIAEDDTFTQIIVFTTTGPDQQDALLAAVLSEVERWVRHQPGFLSASFHRSHDGERVANYAQWRDRASFEAFARHPESGALGERIRAAGVEGGDAHGYRIARVVTAAAARAG